MDLKARKLTLIEWLSRVQDETTITRIEQLLKGLRRSSFPTELKPMSMDEYKKIIEESEEDIKAGRIYSHEEVSDYFKNKK